MNKHFFQDLKALISLDNLLLFDVAFICPKGDIAYLCDIIHLPYAIALVHLKMEYIKIGDSNEVSRILGFVTEA